MQTTNDSHLMELVNEFREMPALARLLTSICENVEISAKNNVAMLERIQAMEKKIDALS